MQKTGNRLIVIGISIAVAGIILSAIANGVYGVVNDSVAYGDNIGAGILAFVISVLTTGLTPFGSTLAAVGVGFRVFPGSAVVDRGDRETDSSELD